MDEARSKAIGSLLVAAIDRDYGSIFYWARVRNVKWDDTPDIWERNVVSFEVKADDEEGIATPGGKWKLITREKISAAIERILHESLAKGVADQFTGAPQDWDVDADGADAVVQIAAFGKLVFG